MTDTASETPAPSRRARILLYVGLAVVAVIVAVVVRVAASIG